MRRFLYFFPGCPGMNPGMMKERGILDRFTLRAGGSKLIEHTVTGLIDGPNGAAGCIVAAGAMPPSIVNRPSSIAPPAPSHDQRSTIDEQRWLTGPTFSVAIEGDAPGPEDLAREIAIGGYETQLSDGNVWRVPLIRRWNEKLLAHEPNVPCVMAPHLVFGKFQHTRKVRAEYEAIDSLAEWIFHAFVAETTIPLDQVIEKAAALLAVNYRLGIEETGLLGLLDESKALQVLRLAADIDRIEAQAQQMAAQGVELIEPKVEEE